VVRRLMLNIRLNAGYFLKLATDMNLGAVDVQCAMGL